MVVNDFGLTLSGMRPSPPTVVDGWGRRRHAVADGGDVASGTAQAMVGGIEWGHFDILVNKTGFRDRMLFNAERGRRRRRRASISRAISARCAAAGHWRNESKADGGVPA